MLLTHEEIDDLSREMVKGNKSVNWLCGKVISAYEAKLREQEPVAFYDGTKFYANEESAICGCADMAKLKPVFLNPAPIPEGWQQFSHTLKYLIGNWREGKGMFPQESDRYDESIAAAHTLLKEADWQQGRYFPVLAAARSE